MIIKMPRPSLICPVDVEALLESEIHYYLAATPRACTIRFLPELSCETMLAYHVEVRCRRDRWIPSPADGDAGTLDSKVRPTAICRRCGMLLAAEDGRPVDFCPRSGCRRTTTPAPLKRVDLDEPSAEWRRLNELYAEYGMIAWVPRRGDRPSLHLTGGKGQAPTHVRNGEGIDEP